MAFCPLAHGSPRLLSDPTLLEIAAANGRSPAQVTTPTLTLNLAPAITLIQNGSSSEHVAIPIPTLTLTYPYPERQESRSCGNPIPNLIPIKCRPLQ